MESPYQDAQGPELLGALVYWEDGQCRQLQQPYTPVLPAQNPSLLIYNAFPNLLLLCAGWRPFKWAHWSEQWQTMTLSFHWPQPIKLLSGLKPMSWNSRTHAWMKPPWGSISTSHISLLIWFLACSSQDTRSDFGPLEEGGEPLPGELWGLSMEDIRWTRNTLQGLHNCTAVLKVHTQII